MPLEAYKVNECVVPQRSNALEAVLLGEVRWLGGKLPVPSVDETLQVLQYYSRLYYHSIHICTASMVPDYMFIHVHIIIWQFVCYFTFKTHIMCSILHDCIVDIHTQEST